MSDEISEEQMEDDLADCIIDLAGARAACEREPSLREEKAQTNVMDAGRYRVPIYIGMIHAKDKELKSLKKQLSEKDARIGMLASEIRNHVCRDVGKIEWMQA